MLELRRHLEERERVNVQPRILAEFEDAALMKLAAASGDAWIPVPSVTVNEGLTRFQLSKVDRIPACSDSFYLNTGDRCVSHPAMRAITENARTIAFA